MFAQIYFLFTQPDEDHCKEAEGPGLVHAGGEGGVTEVVGAVAELLQHVLALVRLALHVQSRPLKGSLQKKNCRFRDVVSIDFTRPPLKPN